LVRHLEVSGFLPPFTNLLSRARPTLSQARPALTPHQTPGQRYPDPRSNSGMAHYTSTLRITLEEPAFVSSISFKYMELFGNWGSNGTIFIDGVSLTGGRNFEGRPSNSRRADTSFTEETWTVDRVASVIELRVVDITRESEIFVDDLRIE